MEKWERELRVAFSESQWKLAVCTTYKYSRCVSHWEQSQKIITRWYLTPQRLSKLYNTHSPLCWRNCDQVGTIAHIFWSCIGLSSFWGKIFEILSTTTGILLQPNPALALLSLGIDNIPPHMRTVVTHILIAARSVIARHWKQSDIPSHLEVIRKINTQYSLVKAYAFSTCRGAQFHRNWSFWSLSKYFVPA